MRGRVPVAVDERVPDLGSGLGSARTTERIDDEQPGAKSACPRLRRRGARIPPTVLEGVDRTRVDAGARAKGRRGESPTATELRELFGEHVSSLGRFRPIGQSMAAQTRAPWHRLLPNLANRHILVE